MNWIKVTSESGKKAFLNVETANYMLRTGDVTRVYFTGIDDDGVKLKETPEQIIELGGQVRIASAEIP